MKEGIYLKSKDLYFEYIEDFDDYIGVVGADGDPWHYFDVYDIKENDTYIFVCCYV